MNAFLALVIAACVVIITGAFVYERRTTDWLEETRQQIPFLETKIAEQKAEVALAKQAIEARKDADANRRALAILKERQRALTEQRANLLKQRREQVIGIRDSLVGTMLTDVTLPSGRRLEQARVTKVDDSAVTLALANGIVRITPQELGPDLRSYFQYDEP